MAGEVNRSINIFLNEADVSASLEKMQAKAKKLEEQMAKTSDPDKWKRLNADLQATNTKMGTLEGQLSGKLNPSLKQMQSALSQARNELNNFVGSQDQMLKKAKEIGKMEADYNKLKEKLDGVRKAAAENTGVFTGFKDAIKGMAQGLPGIGQAFSAMLGPVGLVVGALTALFGLLMQNAEFADEFSFAMEGVKNVVRTLADSLMSLIKNGLEKLRSVLDNPKQALKDFGDALQQNIINRFKAFGVFIDAVSLAMKGEWSAAAKKATDAVIQLGTGVQDGTDKMKAFGGSLKDAYDRGDASARMLDEMTTKQAELNNAMARTNITIAEQTTIMRDGTKTDEQRLAAAQRVIDLETTNANRRIKSIQLELDALRKKQDFLVLSGEEEAKLIDLETQKLQAQAAKVDAIRKATIAKNELETKLAAASMRNLAAEAIQEIDGLTTGALNNFKRVAEASTKELYQSIRYFGKGIKDFLKSDVYDVMQMVIQGVNDLAKSGMQISDNLMQRKVQELNDSFEKENAKLEEQFRLRLISEEVYNIKSDALKKEQARKEAQLKKEAFMKQKALNIALATMNTANAIVNALGTTPLIPTGIIAAALAAATGAAQIAVIATQPVPQFARGGKLAGPRHSEGGVPVAISGRVVAEAEGDEWIINRRSSMAYDKALDAINRDDSSIQWMKGFPRVNMPYPISNGQIAGERDTSSVHNGHDSLKKHVAHGNKLQVEAAKYIVKGIVEGMQAQPYKRSRL